MEVDKRPLPREAEREIRPVDEPDGPASMEGVAKREAGASRKVEGVVAMIPGISEEPEVAVPRRRHFAEGACGVVLPGGGGGS